MWEIFWALYWFFFFLVFLMLVYYMNALNEMNENPSLNCNWPILR